MQAKNSEPRQPNSPNTIEIECFSREYQIAGYDEVMLSSLKVSLVKLPFEEISTFLTYLRAHIRNPKQFIVACEIVIFTEQLWCLAPHVLDFFYELKQRSQARFQELCLRLQDLCVKNHLKLKAHHLDLVVARLTLRVPDDMFTVLDNYLKDHPELAVEQFRPSLQRLREEKLPWIAEQARDCQLSHHNLNHASEIKIRTACAANKLQVLRRDNPVDIFLRQIILLAIECHDFIQIDPRDFLTVEQASAAAVIDWLKVLLCPPPDIAIIINMVVQDIIVLGTTMIYSPVSTMDLSELFFMFEEFALITELAAYLPVAANQDFVNRVNAMTILTGVCDKMPAAIYYVVQQQATQVATNSLQNLKHFYANRPLLIEEFLRHPRYFKAYYPGKSVTVNHQAFFMSMVPHLCMRAELSLKSEPIFASAFVNFVTECQKRLKNGEAVREFMEFFLSAVHAENMPEAVNRLFFGKIENEIQFCNSQSSSLLAASRELMTRNFLDTSGRPLRNHDVNSSSAPSIQYSEELTQYVLISTTVPETDAFNLNGLREFYRELDQVAQHSLVAELLLNIILQAGAIYIKEPQWAVTSQANTPSPRTPPISSFSEGWARYRLYGSNDDLSLPSKFSLRRERDCTSEETMVKAERLSLVDEDNTSHVADTKNSAR